jgi:hypothetical protein
MFLRKRAARRHLFLHEIELQMITREMLFSLLQKTGFRLLAEYGGFDFSVWRPGAANWIIEAACFPKD